jgi:predicted nucleic acid-binding protein
MWNAAARRPFRSSVVKLRKQLEANSGLIQPTTSDWQEGWIEFENGFPGSAGIVDCISFAVMRRLGVNEAFTNDRHFEEAGFKILF